MVVSSFGGHAYYYYLFLLIPLNQVVSTKLLYSHCICICTALHCVRVCTYVYVCVCMYVCMYIYNAGIIAGTHARRAQSRWQ